MEIIIMAVMGIGLYIFAKVMMKEPIIPGREKNAAQIKPSSKKKKGENQGGESEEEPDPFREMFNDLKEINSHMMRFSNNKFVMLAEVEPVNYFLLSQEEQEGIDMTFETWIAQINYPVQWYLQNRYIDLSEPIEAMRQNMLNQEDMNQNSLEYGRTLIEDLSKWQAISPRYETKRYIVFHETINAHEIKADDKEELEEKIIDKAFQELYRRLNTAKNSLRKAEIDVHMLTNEGLGEVFYYAMNRRKAVKNRFKDTNLQEQLALYITADQDLARIETVKEMIERESNKNSKGREERKEEQAS
ncbi:MULTISPECIES: hypothetical protein [Metabacillus]|uniref:hypothetical protein n=1 Tax=Metabacillus TaxID=2675233 RepID=UPI000C7FCFA2|nr:MULTISPECIES: hypothetical protein [Metabacillus]MCM3443612.1 hypothetical protein [Metabacillus halosaccharovorans]PMC34229.1 hypothetical protein CJ195_24230 [Bacillus sp. UMB0899]